MERFIEGSKKFVVDCRKRYSCKDSRLDDLDKVFTSFLRSPLHIAAMTGDIRFAKEIISSSLDPNLNLSSKQDSSKFTPLHLASARTSLQMVRLLLNAYPGACTVQGKDGKTPLHLAAMKNRVQVIKLLTKDHQNLDALHMKNDQNGDTILHLCVKSNISVKTLELLVGLVLARTTNQNPISINSKDNDGNTVLHLAVEMGRIEIRNYLLHSNNLEIDLDARNNKGQTALDILCQDERDHLEIGVYDYFGHTKELTDEIMSEKKNYKEVVNKNSPKNRSHKERVNVLLVVATLIAGIAYQAMLNPPGGVWQEDSKVDSGTDPIIFGYYLFFMFGSSVSDHLESYIRDNLLHLYNSTSNMSTATGWKGHSKAQENLYHFIIQLRDDYDTTPDSTIKGLILEDYTNATVSAYNNSDGGGKFFPYLIRYAGFPVMAYKDPEIYMIYMLVNTIAFSLSLTVVFAIICGFVQDKSVAQNRILVMLMCISIGCISISYLIVLGSLMPYFFIKNQTIFSVCIYFGLCCICGIGLFLWRLISRLIELEKKHLSVFNYFKALFTMDASAAGKVALLIICLCAFYWTSKGTLF